MKMWQAYDQGHAMGCQARKLGTERPTNGIADSGRPMRGRLTHAFRAGVDAGWCETDWDLTPHPLREHDDAPDGTDVTDDLAYDALRERNSVLANRHSRF